MTANALGVPGVILYHGRYQASSSAPTDALPLPLAQCFSNSRARPPGGARCDARGARVTRGNMLILN